MIQKKPKVSVLTPLYNTNPQHLRECIESILNQTFTDFEFIILNDSPENKELDKIVKSYKDKRIKYFKNDKNMGISAARNKLLDMARGEYVAIFDHDDISMPDRLEQEVKFLDDNPHIGVVSGWIECFGFFEVTRNTPKHDFEIKVALTDNCVVCHTAAMIRKSILSDNGIKYEECYTPAEDYCLWARLMDITHFYNIQAVLVKYRTYPTQTSVNQDYKMSIVRRAIYTEIRDKHPYLYKEFLESAHRTRFRVRLFGVPLLKIKNNWVYLFECIPLFCIRWR